MAGRDSQLTQDDYAEPSGPGTNGVLAAAGNLLVLKQRRTRKGRRGALWTVDRMCGWLAPKGSPRRRFRLGGLISLDLVDRPGHVRLWSRNHRIYRTQGVWEGPNFLALVELLPE